MKTYLNRIAALLGYVPAPAKSTFGTVAIQVDLDSASLDATIARLEQATAAADDTELALNRITLAAHVAAKALDQVQALAPVEAQFAPAELAGQDFADPPALAEMRKQTTLLEVLAKQGEIAAVERRYLAERRTVCADLCSVVRPATGAAASGLPG